MPWGRAVDEWAAYMRASACTPATIEARVYQVSRVGREVGGHPATVAASELVAWLAIRAAVEAAS